MIDIYHVQIRPENKHDSKNRFSLKTLMISDLYFCIFDAANCKKNEMLLEFWANICSIISVDKIINKDEILIVWRQRDLKVFIDYNYYLPFKKEALFNDFKLQFR